jgi:hypothetical protein
MNEYLKTFDTIRFVMTWSIFRVFLKNNFCEFKFEFLNRTGLEPAEIRTSPDRLHR